MSLGPLNKCLLLMVLILPLSHPGLAQSVKYTITDNPTEQLIVDLMKQGFANSALKNQIQFNAKRESVNEARKVQMLTDKQLDIIWTGTTARYEQQLYPIRIPILKGMLGHRIFIIRAGDQVRFNKITQLSQLKNVPLGQGKFWGDTQVLKNADMTVVDPVKYESLFHMLEGGRFDFFPRALHEPWSEVASRPELQLQVETKHLLIYPFALYFFVHKDNQRLGEQLHTGLMRSVADGSYDELFYNHPVIAETLSRSALGARTVHRLNNPNMTPETPTQDKRLWLNVMTSE
ncbi:diguanylate cyclase [Planctobacterium marinum]|uniref:Solute-binding protein family 3/N-terminal domain-containing protein n=1 Tax=Planctobacterium marinum TaxID=1631968 RepID=A0AA48HRH4_9ALTE|nr:hypothetical protein MACH26_37930 [Planctobacterium marinum]